MDGSSIKDVNSIKFHKVDGSSMKDENSIKSIKWTVHLWRIKTLVHKVDGSSKENDNFSPFGGRTILE